MQNWKIFPKPAETYTLVMRQQRNAGGTMDSKTVEVGKPVDLPKAPSER